MHLCSCHNTYLLALAKYFFSNNKLLKNLEGEGDMGKEDFLQKSHVVVEYMLEYIW